MCVKMPVLIEHFLPTNVANTTIKICHTDMQPEILEHIMFKLTIQYCLSDRDHS